MLKVKESKKTVMINVTSMLITFILMQLFVMVCKGPHIFLVYYDVFFCMTFFTFLNAALRKPGYVKPSNKITFLELNEYFDPA